MSWLAWVAAEAIAVLDRERVRQPLARAEIDPELPRLCLAQVHHELAPRVVVKRDGRTPRREDGGGGGRRSGLHGANSTAAAGAPCRRRPILTGSKTTSPPASLITRSSRPSRSPPRPSTCLPRIAFAVRRRRSRPRRAVAANPQSSASPHAKALGCARSRRPAPWRPAPCARVCGALGGVCGRPSSSPVRQARPKAERTPPGEIRGKRDAVAHAGRARRAAGCGDPGRSG
jgi:hypothetical protein